MELKREAPTPLYVQLKNSLLMQITSNQLAPHQQLPSERELCEQFGVSRTTVRQAINEMIHEGLVYSRAGKGTFVSEPKINQQLRTLTGFSQDVLERGGTPSSQVLEARLIPATPDLAERLQVTLETELVLGDLGAVRDWSDARDVMRGAVLALGAREPGDYVLASGTGRTVGDLVETALAAAGVEGGAERWVRVDPAFVRPREPVALVGDTRHARAALGWEPEIPFERMIAEMVETDLRELRA